MFEFDRATEILKSPEESMDGLVFVAAFEVLGSCQYSLIRRMAAIPMPMPTAHQMKAARLPAFFAPI